jgi:hypothetical protein
MAQLLKKFTTFMEPGSLLPCSQWRFTGPCLEPVNHSLRMPHITLKGRWYDIILLNMHAPTEDKDDNIKDNFYEELEQIFDQFSRYHMKNFARIFQCKDREEGHL